MAKSNVSKVKCESQINPFADEFSQDKINEKPSFKEGLAVGELPVNVNNSLQWLKMSLQDLPPKQSPDAKDFWEESFESEKWETNI